MNNSNIIGLNEKDCQKIAEKLNVLLSQLFHILPKHPRCTLEY